MKPGTCKKGASKGGGYLPKFGGKGKKAKLREEAQVRAGSARAGLVQLG